jgi:hypothetical protein
MHRILQASHVSTLLKDHSEQYAAFSGVNDNLSLTVRGRRVYKYLRTECSLDGSKFFGFKQLDTDMFYEWKAPPSRGSLKLRDSVTKDVSTQ